MQAFSALQHLAIEYLAAYSAKNLSAIQAMLGDDVALQDWNVAGKGADFFLEQTRLNFDSAHSIEIEILNLLENEMQVAAQLKIVIDGHIELDVIDLITFDESRKIVDLRAYKG